MRKGSNTYYTSYRLKDKISPGVISLFLLLVTFLSACDLIKIKGDNSESDSERQPAARANNSYLYKDELNGIVAPGTPAEPGVELREIDNPRNTIIRLPNYIVREDKTPVLKERDVRTPKASLELALRRHPGLRLGSFWIFRNDGIALALLAEEERLERKKEFEDMVSLMPVSDPAARATVKREVQQAFLREADFGR